MKNIIWLLLIVLSMLPLAHAGDIGTVNQTMTLFADVLTTPSYYPANGANITVRNSTGTIVVNNLRMTQLLPGLYAYNFTPNTTGQYYTITTYENTTSTIGSASSTFYVQPKTILGSSNMTGLGVIIALGIAIAIFAYMAFAFKSENNGTNAVWKVFSLIMVVLLLVLLAWAAVDSNKDCAFISTSGGYEYLCEEAPAQQGSMFLKLMLVVMTIFFVWISVALFISSIDALRKTGKI